MECCDRAVKKAVQSVRENIGHFGFSNPDEESSETYRLILKTLDEVEKQWKIMQIQKESTLGTSH